MIKKRSCYETGRLVPYSRYTTGYFSVVNKKS